MKLTECSFHLGSFPRLSRSGTIAVDQALLMSWRWQGF